MIAICPKTYVDVGFYNRRTEYSGQAQKDIRSGMTVNSVTSTR